MTDAVYVVVLPTVPVLTSPVEGLSTIVLNLGSLDGARVTTIEYVRVAAPFCDVTTVLIVVVEPSAPKAIGPDGAPEATVALFTVIAAVASCAVGVTFTDVIPLPTTAL